MNRQKWILLCVALAMMAGAAAALARLKASQRLGQPGINTAPIAGSERLDILLPQKVLNYYSEVIPTDTNVLQGLPHDTSIAQRRFISAENANDWLLMNVVLMGTDRTSIHKPQFCLQGSGWDFNDQDASADTVRIAGPRPYNLPVTKIMMSRVVNLDGRPTTVRGIFVYWFVADGDLTASHWTRMWRSVTHLLKTGELERWAYIACLGVCQPGDEDAELGRMKKFIAAAVPEFQPVTGSRVAAPGGRASVQ